MLELPLKKDYVTGRFGFVERFVPKSYVHGRGFTLTTSVSPEGDVVLPSEGYLYIGEMFIPLSASNDRLGPDGLEKYVKARKPVHVLFEPRNLIITLNVKTTVDAEGAVTVKPTAEFFKPLSTSSNAALKLSNIVRVNENYRESVLNLGKRIADDGVYTRLDYLKWREENHA